MEGNLFLISNESLMPNVRGIKVAYLGQRIHLSKVHQLVLGSLGSVMYKVIAGYPNPDYHYQLKKQQVE